MWGAPDARWHPPHRGTPHTAAQGSGLAPVRLACRYAPPFAAVLHGLVGSQGETARRFKHSTGGRSHRKSGLVATARMEL